MMDDILFPHVKKKIDDFLYDEEGNIPINKVMTIGSMMLVLGLLMADDAYAAHKSHSSHRSHSSHSSGYGGHSSHSSHSSGTSYKTTQEPAHVSHNNVAPDKSVMNAMSQVGDADKANIYPALHSIKDVKVPMDTTGLDVKE